MQDIEYYLKSFEAKKRIMQDKAVSGNEGRMFENFISKRPVVFCIETTNVCNMSCVMCPRTDKMKRQLGHMDLKLYEKIIDQISPYSEVQRLKWQRFLNLELFPSRILSNIDEDFFNYVVSSQCLTLHGFGEPPLDPHIVERIKIASKKGIPTYFSCNPINMGDQMFENLVDAGISYLKYSIDGLDEETVERYRKRKLDINSLNKQINRNIELIKKKNAPTVLVLTMLEFGGNIKQNRKFLDNWRNSGAFTYIKNSHHRWLFQEEGTPENTSAWVRCFCEYPWNSLSILYDGTVVPCPLDYDGAMAMGNINDASLEEIWQSGKYKNFRAMHAKGNITNDHFCRAQCDMTILGDVINKKRQ